MLRPKQSAILVASVTLASLIHAFGSGAVGRQQKTDQPPPAPGKPTPIEKSPPAAATVEADETETVIDKAIAEYNLKPHPMPPIPDDPPPHEGAMISLPYTVEPPDLILVELLDALPGRPISGERMVRPDGTITLGFYGDVLVKGLTLDQVKVAIIKHLRPLLGDDTLGLIESDWESMTPQQRLGKPVVPDVPEKGESPLEVKDTGKPHTSNFQRPSTFRSVKPRAASHRPAMSGLSVQRISRTTDRQVSQEKAAAEPAANPLTIPAGGSGKVTITVQVDAEGPPAAKPAPDVPRIARRAKERRTLVPPDKSRRVFVDVTAYNNKNYYVLGDVAVIGRFPWTGHETVLDALQFAGGLESSAEPKDIRLVRPARGGKPGKVYKVDLAAIQERGDIMANYQIFPGDRLIVGRNEVVKKTTEIDRLSAPLLSITGNILQQAFTLRSLQFATVGDRNELLKECVDFWAKELARPGGVKLDEQTLRDAFIHTMKLPVAPPTNPGPR
jgi:protein involved in polysaccharide export with SLBB domain